MLSNFLRFPYGFWMVVDGSSESLPPLLNADQSLIAYCSASLVFAIRRVLHLIVLALCDVLGLIVRILHRDFVLPAAICLGPT